MYYIKKKQHTSDIRLEIKADNLNELFTAGMMALSKEIAGAYYPTSFSKDFSETFDITAIDHTSLLIDFLSDLLALGQIHQVIFFDVNFLQMENFHLQAEVYGMKMENIAEEIKAVTYHEAEVIFKEGHYQTNLVFDI